MEVWILLGIAAAIVAFVAISRLIRRRKAAADNPQKDIYPLW